MLTDSFIHPSSGTSSAVSPPTPSSRRPPTSASCAAVAATRSSARSAWTPELLLGLENTTHKTRILDVNYNASNNELVRSCFRSRRPLSPSNRCRAEVGIGEDA